MREIIPAARLKMDMSETLNRALQLEEFHIENIVTPNIINLGQKDKLQSISVGIDRVRFLESELRNQWALRRIRSDIWKISAGMLVVAIIVSCIVAWLVIRKIRKSRVIGKGKQMLYEGGTDGGHVSDGTVDGEIGKESANEVEEQEESGPAIPKRNKMVAISRPYSCFLFLRKRGSACECDYIWVQKYG